ncbi:hypothetical protein MRB53_000359 [Persea americana]|uniref:Uncharacterized protein n=1 Tax=Persea americana TaxID=3435 RepID=A0ACC2MNL4_PERAE|nr:hypothetical protein MRB53_000359 [Persea americana]
MQINGGFCSGCWSGNGIVISFYSLTPQAAFLSSAQTNDFKILFSTAPLLSGGRICEDEALLLAPFSASFFGLAISLSFFSLWACGTGEQELFLPHALGIACDIYRERFATLGNPFHRKLIFPVFGLVNVHGNGSKTKRVHGNPFVTSWVNRKPPIGGSIEFLVTNFEESVRMIL